MGRTRDWVLLVAVLLLTAALAYEHLQTRRLASQLASLQKELAAPVEADPGDAKPRETQTTSGNAAVLRRLAALEQTIAQLARNSDYLMERGHLPMATNKMADFLAKLSDITAADRDRLQALRLLRRNGGIGDEAIQHALAWLQTATNANIREDILNQLEGSTNSALRGPLLAYAADPDPDVREQAVDNLRRFMNDPQVEAHLWHMLNDADEDVRDQVREALVEGPMSDARAAALRERLADANTPLDERLLAWRALRERNQDAADASGWLAEIAQNSPDPIIRARLFEEFDEAIDRGTPRDAALLPALLQGLQDPSALVRERAADALNDFSAEPGVQDWLRWAAQNDPDPAVRKEAARMLARKL